MRPVNFLLGGTGPVYFSYKLDQGRTPLWSLESLPDCSMVTDLSAVSILNVAGFREDLLNPLVQARGRLEPSIHRETGSMCVWPAGVEVGSQRELLSLS